MEQEKVKEKIIEMSDYIAKILVQKRRDVEIRTTKNGVTVAEVQRKLVKKENS